MANPASSERPRGGKLARSAAMLCQDHRFRGWLDARRSVVHGTHDEQMTAEWLRNACQVQSRADLDHSEYGGKMFQKIMHTYFRERGGDS